MAAVAERSAAGSSMPCPLGRHLISGVRSPHLIRGLLVLFLVVEKFSKRRSGPRLSPIPGSGSPCSGRPQLPRQLGHGRSHAVLPSHGVRRPCASHPMDRTVARSRRLRGPLCLHLCRGTSAGSSPPVVACTGLRARGGLGRSAQLPRVRPNKRYLDSSFKLILLSDCFFSGPPFDGFGARVRLQSYLRPLSWSAQLRAMMESRAQGANR